MEGRVILQRILINAEKKINGLCFEFLMAIGNQKGVSSNAVREKKDFQQEVGNKYSTNNREEGKKERLDNKTSQARA